jgi:hypothetical protein
VERTIKQAAVIAVLAVVGGAFVACSGSSGGGGNGGSDAGGNASSSGGASSSGASSSGASSSGASSSGASSSGSGSSSGTTADAAGDEQICSTACTALTGCGVTYPTSCATDCLAKSVFIACAASAGTDCNALALCAFEQSAATNCSSGAGVPSGTGSCDALRTCNAGCFSSASKTSCTCTCETALAPAKALDALVDDTCAQTKCASQCSGTSTATECGACETTNCASQVSQCTSN